MKHLASLPRRAARAIVPAVIALTVIGGTAAIAAPARAGLSHGSVHAEPANPPVFTWHPLALSNGWKQAGNSKLVYGPAEWALVNGVVYLRGAIRQPASGSDVFAVLPKAARPARNLYLEVQTADFAPGVVRIGADGTMRAYFGNATGLTSLAAISYPAATMKQAKLGLEHGWVSSQPVYGTGDPSYAISGGVVYLSGSLHSSGTSHVATLLPKAARPAQPLFVQVYENAGSTGWLQILPTGQVEVFGPFDYLYTSLAGVSYPASGAKWHALALTAGWLSGAAKFHTAAPAYTVIGGVVYLNGSMYAGPTVSNGLWAVLPAGVKTKADVLPIEVDTSGGNSGSLAITSSLGLIGSTPIGNARAFTSLAGVAYPQSS
jgi:hypothetical protein